MDVERERGNAEWRRHVAHLCQAWIAENPLRAVVVYVAQRGQVLLDTGWGLVSSLAATDHTQHVKPDTIFLVASLTKPITALALCLLVERGEVLLDDPVNMYIPAFTDGERPLVRLRHLLTHTSGLPDMLPENAELRAAHAPLSVFVEHTCTTPLLFTPGTNCRYQSMGTLLAGAVIESVSGLPLPVFMEREIFRPLGLKDTYLGLGGLPQDRIARVLLKPEDSATSWHWNSAYWRALGAPWGGLHTTARDYGRVLELMLNGGEVGGARVLGNGTVRAMLSSQLDYMPAIPARVRLEQAWGLGWRLNQPPGTHSLPELGSPRVFGHAGATGTVAWADPDSGLACVILTNDPESSPFRSRLSNIVAGRDV